MRRGDEMFVTGEERVVFVGGDMRARGESVFEVLRFGEGDECVGANGVGIFGGNSDAVSVWTNGSSVCVWEWSVRYDDLRRRRDEVRRDAGWERKDRGREYEQQRMLSHRRVRFRRPKRHGKNLEGLAIRL